jgi:ubiquinone biosynthesis protein
MTATAGEAPAIKRVLVATDRSPTAERAVRWAANLAASHEAELLLLQVLTGIAESNGQQDGAPSARDRAARDLQRAAEEIAGPRGRALVVVGEDPAQEVVEAAEREAVDVIVVGNVGMSGRKEFLLGNIPNRISHNARCTVTIVNTAPETASREYPRRSAAEGAAPGRRQLAARAVRIGRVLLNAGLRELLSGTKSPDEQAMRARAQRLRAALDELGPTFAKLGQILSTRPDLLPPVLIDELATLQDRVTPLTEAEVVRVMERELGVPWEDVFAGIDPVPLAAGTIAQVHRATLETGERVVVKVQRPTAQDDILQDLGLLEMLAARVANRPKFREALDVPAIIEHLSTSLRRELDFRGEAANIKRMAEVLAPFPRLGVPGVYEEYSTARLLVMEEIQGVPVREAPPGPARQEAARQLLEAYYHQVMTAGFFHADPHPGNMKWWNEKIYLLDLGMVGQVEEGARQLILLLMLAFAEKDAPFLTQIVLMLSGGVQGGAAIDTAAFQEDLAQLIADFRDLSLRELQLGPLLQQVARIAVRHRVRIPASFTLTGKAFAQMQLVAGELDPTLDPFTVAEQYVLRNTIGQLTRNLEPQTLFYEGQKLRLRLVRLLEAFEGAVGARPGASMQVDFRTERLEGAIAQAGRQVSLALGLSGALAVTGITANSARAPRWVPMVLGSMSSALAAGLLLDRPRRRS